MAKVDNRIFTVLILLTLLGALSVQTESNMIGLAPIKLPIRRGYDFFDYRMRAVSIMVYTGNPNGTKDLQLQKNMDAL
ncbi:MAG: hypothetical protein COA36_04100 [Desulfotalea sp.]|nr:MAG: hypothetical protein COA36_04100 [Desulfotalea sp.]